MWLHFVPANFLNRPKSSSDRGRGKGIRIVTFFSHLTDKTETTRLRCYCIAKVVHKTGPSEHSDRESESENQNNPDAWTRPRFSALAPCTRAPRSYQNRLLANQTIGKRPCRCVLKGQKKTCWKSGPGFLGNSKAKHFKTKAMTK